jgi:glycosyltransferase involved in cell wall biosynthesis
VPDADASRARATATYAHVRDGRLHLVVEVSGADRPRGSLALDCVQRSGGKRLAVPLSRTGGGFQCAVEVDALLGALGSPGESIDFFLVWAGGSDGAGETQVRLRLAVTQLGDETDPFPRPVTGRLAGAKVELTLYSTRFGNLSARVAPARAGRRPEPPRLVAAAAQAWFRRVEARVTRQRATRDTRPAAETRKVYYLIRSCFGMGGTVRTVISQANELAGLGYDVEILSLLRPLEHPTFPIDPRVKITVLFDERFRRLHKRRHNPLPGLTSAPAAFVLAMVLDRWASQITYPDEPMYARASLLTDLVLVHKLRSLEPGVLMSTRASLNVAAARYAGPRVVTVGQEHLNYSVHSGVNRAWMLRSYAKLDALAVLTHGDEQDYARALSGRPTLVRRIPNGIPRFPDQQSDLNAKVVLSAGTLARRKGFDLLLPAFAKATRDDPEWELRIFGGGGTEEESLLKQIDELGLAGRAHLMGRSTELEKEMARASIYVLSSRFEGLPMVIIEAMSSGLPVVAFDCPRGPADMVEPGVNGLLVPPRDSDALAAALQTLIGDRPLRQAMGREARRRAEDYSLGRISRMWEELMRDLTGER